MPFEEVETVTRHNRPPEATLTYMRQKGRGGKASKPDAKPALIVTIPTSICGIGKLKKHVMMLGTGNDAGRLRIKGVSEADAKPGAIKPTEFTSHFIWRFGFVPKLGDEIFDQQKCAVRKIDDDQFEIDVPKSWFNGG